MKEMMLSIICNTYNHEKYIEEALKGFLSQKTSYAFEVLVHDDASTDGTAEIIRAYEKKYPEIIKPTYQVENQHKRINITLAQIAKAKGKYFAFCEGDDFWNDTRKIQRQIDYMESHPECTLCIHNSFRRTVTGKELPDIVITEEDRIVPTEEFIKGGGGFCATSSILSRMELAMDPPDFYKKCSYDLSWQLYLAASGYAYCFADRMSTYRVGVAGSWNDRMERDPAEYSRVLASMDDMLKEFNDWSGHKYDNAVQDSLDRGAYILAIKTNDRDALKNERINNWVRKQSPSFRLKYCLWKYFPKIYYSIRKNRLKTKYGFNIKK